MDLSAIPLSDLLLEIDRRTSDLRALAETQRQRELTRARVAKHRSAKASGCNAGCNGNVTPDVTQNHVTSEENVTPDVTVCNGNVTVKASLPPPSSPSPFPSPLSPPTPSPYNPPNPRIPAAASPAAAGKKPLPEKPETAADPRFVPVVTGYCEAYAVAFGEPYAHNGGRDGAALKKLLKSLGNTEYFTAQRIVGTAIKAMERRQKPYARDCKHVGNLHTFCAHYNNIRAELKDNPQASAATPVSHYDN